MSPFFATAAEVAEGQSSFFRPDDDEEEWACPRRLFWGPQKQSLLSPAQKKRERANGSRVELLHYLPFHFCSMFVCYQKCKSLPPKKKGWPFSFPRSFSSFLESSCKRRGDISSAKEHVKDAKEARGRRRRRRRKEEGKKVLTNQEKETQRTPPPTPTTKVQSKGRRS